MYPVLLNGRAAVFFPALVALALGARHAEAHGGFWRPDELKVDPSDSSHLLLRSDVWGMIETPDFGKTWRWTCAAAAYGDDVSVFRAPLVFLPGGTLIIGSPRSGVIRSKGSLCDFEVLPFFQTACAGTPCTPYDIAQQSGSSPSLVVLAPLGEGAGKFQNLLFRSADSGTSWEAMPGALPTDVFATSIVAAPSDPSVLYVGSSDTAVPPTLSLHRSTDGGQTFQKTTIPAALTSTDPALRVRFYGVHPNNSKMVFIWLDADVGDPNALAPDRLFVSSDGGVTITEAFRSVNDLPGFALSPDGATVYIGGTNDGLWSASTADLESGKPNSFTRVNAGNTWALAFTDRGLLAGREEFIVEGGATRMSLGLSTDLGATFEPAMVICDVQPATCPTGTQSANLCPDLYYGTKNFQDDQQLRRCADSKSPTDAGAPVPKATPAVSDDSGCRAAPGRAGSWSGFDALWFGVLVSTYRRIRRVRGQPSSRTTHRTD